MLTGERPSVDNKQIQSTLRREDEGMITLEEKLQQFHDLVHEKVEKEIGREVSEKKIQIQTFLEEEKARLQTALDREKTASVRRIDRQKSERISALKQEEKRKYLRKNEIFIRDLIQNVEQKARDYVLGEEYVDFVIRLFSKTLKEAKMDVQKEFVLYLCPPRFDQIKEKIAKNAMEEGYTSFEIKEGEIRDIGGFILEIPQDNVRINKTIAKKLESMRDPIGQYLSDYVREGAEWNG